MAVVGHNNHIPANTTISAIVDSTTCCYERNKHRKFSTGTFTSTNGIPTVCGMVPFTDKNDMRRLGDYWTIGSEGRIFFLKEYPYHSQILLLLLILRAAVGFRRLFTKPLLSWFVLKSYVTMTKQFLLLRQVEILASKRSMIFFAKKHLKYYQVKVILFILLTEVFLCLGGLLSKKITEQN